MDSMSSRLSNCFHGPLYCNVNPYTNVRFRLCLWNQIQPITWYIYIYMSTCILLQWASACFGTSCFPPYTSPHPLPLPLIHPRRPDQCMPASFMFGKLSVVFLTGIDSFMSIFIFMLWWFLNYPWAKIKKVHWINHIMFLCLCEICLVEKHMSILLCPPLKIGHCILSRNSSFQFLSTFCRCLLCLLLIILL